jgi:transcriptional regulator with XRE-family HTH domain
VLGDTRPVPTVGQLLRDWRRLRNLSQLDLAIQADVSARHISFVETGRTVPSSAMVLRLAAELDVPLRDRNRLLVAAGHAPVYRERPPDDPDFGRVREALGRIVRAHSPYPAVALDRRWHILIANPAFDVLAEGAGAELLRPPVNMMRLGFHPDGLAPRLRNLVQVRAHLLPRLGRQAARTGDSQLMALHEELLGYGPNAAPQPPDPADIALPIRLEHRGDELFFINTVTTFGAPFDLALEEVTIETYLPADEATAEHCRRLDRTRTDEDAG